VSRDVLLQVLFNESSSPKPLKITLGSFRFFFIRGDIRTSQGAPGINYTGGNLPPVSTTPVANLTPVSTTPVANLPPVSTTAAVHLELRIFPRVFEKI
jgi:hypothetical protein